jgi:hypothetical protein
VSWDVRRLLPVYIGLRQVPGEDGGDVLGGYAVQVLMDLWRPLDRGPRLRERLSGPHRTEVRLGGAAPGRLLCRRHATQAASPASGTCARRYHDREQANDCGHGQDRRPAEHNLARSEQDFAYWFYSWGEAP